eukprot:GFKZ01013339.1.p1 GENE.GFKZ01013339.1~~GFKZ01013339.1.p1  ORF type:complete len:197 (+),score=14.26 GFKZ01013339.1:77-592(+)
MSQSRFLRLRHLSKQKAISHHSTLKHRSRTTHRSLTKRQQSNKRSAEISRLSQNLYIQILEQEIQEEECTQRSLIREIFIHSEKALAVRQHVRQLERQMEGCRSNASWIQKGCFDQMLCEGRSSVIIEGVVKEGVVGEIEKVSLTMSPVSVIQTAPEPAPALLPTWEASVD